MNATNPYQVTTGTNAGAYSDGDEGGMATSNATVFLALYLILLGFFIVINAKAEISEQRARAVIQGLNAPLIQPIAVTPNPSVLVSDLLEARLTDVFRQSLVDDEWQLRTRDGAIIIDLLQRRVFPPESAVLQPGRIAMFRRLSDALTAIDGLKVAVTVGGSAGATLPRRRAAALGRDLARFGVPAAMLSVGIAGSDSPMISMELILPAEGG